MLYSYSATQTGFRDRVDCGVVEEKTTTTVLKWQTPAVPADLKGEFENVDFRVRGGVVQYAKHQLSRRKRDFVEDG